MPAHRRARRRRGTKRDHLAREGAIGLDDPGVLYAGGPQARRERVQLLLVTRGENHRERPRRDLPRDRLAGRVDGLGGGDTCWEIRPQHDVVAERIFDRPGVNGSCA